MKAGLAGNMKKARDVLLRNEQGEYLGCSSTGTFLTKDRTKAHVYDYEKDHIKEQIHVAKTCFDESWTAEPVETQKTSRKRKA